MLKFLALLLCLISTFGFAHSVHVRASNPRSGAIHHQAHYRTSPNHTQRDNWSTKGNINPYTLKPGTRRPKR